MNAPYVPGGLRSKMSRQLSRFLAREECEVLLDHAIVSFTFDDFPKSAAVEGAQQLEARSWRGTYYACAGLAETENHHGLMFSAEDITRLERDGHEIACHTFEHLDCAKASSQEIETSIDKNAIALKAMGLQSSLNNFAFPYGEVSPSAKLLLNARFDTLRGIRAEVNRGRSDFNLLSSVPLDGGEAGIARACEAAESLMKHPGWLIFYAHDIQEPASEWGCTPAEFARVLEAVDASGAKVLPVDAALNALAEVTV